jgi:hypothetical protein
MWSDLNYWRLLGRHPCVSLGAPPRTTTRGVRFKPKKSDINFIFGGLVQQVDSPSKWLNRNVARDLQSRSL